MGQVLNWGTPKRAMTPEARNKISADGAPPGVYTVNASKEDEQKWWALLKGMRKPPLYVEAKKSFGPTLTRLVLKVYENGDVRFSANGTVQMEAQDWVEFGHAVEEAAAAIWHHKHGKESEGY